MLLKRGASLLQTVRERVKPLLVQSILMYEVEKKN
jgi:hypothetical protein